MKVLHVALDVNPINGGPPRSIAGLCRAEADAGLDVTLFIHDSTGCETANLGKCKLVKGSGRYREGHWREDVAAVLDAVKPDIVHQHAMWCLPLHVDDVECRKRGIPYIIAPRGSLEPWSLQQAKLKKRLARWLYQDRDLKLAAALHATAESEAEQFRRLGFKNKIIVSPNGVNVPEMEMFECSNVRNVRMGGSRRALFVSRMHPKKGVLELVEAWARVFKKEKGKGESEKVWTCELVYTMNSEEERAYEQKVKQRVHELGMDDRFVFTGALDDAKKWEAYGRAELFVLPTYSENFGIVVAEALWAGVPVITTKGAPWKDLEEHKCGWWVEPTVDAFAGALREATSMDLPDLRTRGELGHRLIELKYSWSAVTKAMLDGYRDVLSNARSANNSLQGQ